MIELLKRDKTSESAKVASSEKILEYIETANQYQELINWTVVVVDGNKNIDEVLGDYPVNLGDVKINSAVLRGANRNGDRVDIGAIVADKQEFIDIDPTIIEGIKEKSDRRKKRPKENGVLLIYPLHPGVEIFNSLDVNFSDDLVPIGIALSFPDAQDDSSFDKTKRYGFNKTVKEAGDGKK